MKVRTRKEKLSYFNYLIALTFLLMFVTLGYSKEESPTANGGTPAIEALIGTWNATSVTKNGGPTNLISAENTVKLKFTATHYTYKNTGQFCDVKETCTETGAVTATAKSFTVTWSNGVTDTPSYTLSGNTLTIIAKLDDGTYTFICQKQ